MATNEPIKLVRIYQPSCYRTFGVAPCDATAEIGGECFNTRGTCRSVANYLRGDDVELWFSDRDVDVSGPGAPTMVIPSLKSVSTVPTKINLAASNPDSQGLGNRASVTLTFQDHPYADYLVDPYLSTRTYDAFSQSSFWRKFKARNKYLNNFKIEVYDGYNGDALADMIKRTYFLEPVIDISSSGLVQLKAKDVLARLEDRKVQVPEASPGELAANISNSATSITVQGALIGDYPSSGTLRINDEVMKYSSVSDSGGGILTFSISARGTDGTSADSHKAEDGVQECVRYVDENIVDVLTDILVTRGGIPSSIWDEAGAQAEVDQHLDGYLLNRLITEPKAATSLASEVSVQCPLFIWWNEREAMIKLKAIRAHDVSTDLLTEEHNIVADSFQMVDRPRQRASRVIFYYDKRDPTDSDTQVSSYKNSQIVANLGSEGEDQYGEKSIRTVYGTFLDSKALALNSASILAVRYVDVPREATFKLSAKDRQYWTGDTIQIRHSSVVNEFGEQEDRYWTIIQAEETLPGAEITYLAQDTTIYGNTYFVSENSASDYADAARTDSYMYICQNDGTYSNGDDARLIS